MLDRMSFFRSRVSASQTLFDHPLRPVLGGLVLLALLALPALLEALGLDFYVSVASRILIFGIAASSLNLILGFGGLVSFGHAAFVGVGAYTVGILMGAGYTQALMVWPAAALVAGVVAWWVGAISLRTRGVYFIMITLAFAQMLYFFAVSLKTYGGEDGLSLPGRPVLGAALQGDTDYYYAVLAVACAVFVLIGRLLNARFGQVLQALRENETRTTAIGFDGGRYQRVAFALAGGLAGLAGGLLANHGSFVSPSIMHWSQSGMLMVMVILGGVGHLWGGWVGALVFLLLEEGFSHFTIHWQFFLGAVLLLVVLVAPHGLLRLRLPRALAHSEQGPS